MFIVNSDELQLSRPFLMCVVTLAGILSTSLLFVSFAISRTVSKVKKKGCSGKKFYTLLKFFLNKNFTFLKYLKNDYSNFIAIHIAKISF